jgi:hypothetical protein
LLAITTPVMLAAQKDDDTENKVEENDLFSNIFAGLSFPDAPTNTFIQVCVLID